MPADSVSNTLSLSDAYSTSIGYASAVDSSQLALSSYASATITVSGVVDSVLGLASSVAAAYNVVASTMSTLLLSDTSGVVNSRRVQYAVNANTGGVAEYSGFDFDGFTRSGQRTYAFTPTGVFALAPGADDAGQPIDASVDFGDKTLGSVGNKFIEYVHLGVDTDGTVDVTLVADGVSRTYPAATRDGMTRAPTAKGIVGRKWGVHVAIKDATRAELDAVDIEVGVNGSRWKPK